MCVAATNSPILTTRAGEFNVRRLGLLLAGLVGVGVKGKNRAINAKKRRCGVLRLASASLLCFVSVISKLNGVVSYSPSDDNRSIAHALVADASVGEPDMAKNIAIPTILSIVMSIASVADAQVMVKQEFPFQTNRDSFFEYTGMSWNLRGPNFVASFAQPFQGAPAFGNFDPTAGIQTGFGFRSGRFSGDFNFNFAQGFSRTSTSVTPVINSLSGYPASLTAGVFRPYVLGLQPVFAPGFGGGGFGGGGFGGGFNNGGLFNVPYYNVPQQPVPYRVVPRETALQGVMRRLEERGGATVRSQAPKPEPVRVDENRESVASRYFNTSGGTLAAAPVQSPVPAAEPEADETQSVAMKLFRQGMDAEKKSKTGTARMYYRIASEKATGALKQRIALKLSQLR
jgi:hypothetical protein